MEYYKDLLRRVEEITQKIFRSGGYKIDITVEEFETLQEVGAFIHNSILIINLLSSPSKLQADYQFTEKE